MPDIPRWLTEPESYSPPKDRDRFLDRSILSFVELLSRIRSQSALARDGLWVSPASKLAAAALYLVLVSLAQQFAFVYIMLAYTAVLLALLPAKDLRRCLSGAALAAALAYLILLPSALAGSRYSITMIPAKTFVCVALVNILSRTTRWDRLAGALRQFFFPGLFIFVIDITVKYIFLLGEFALQMLYALRLRSVGRNRSKYGSLGGVAGSLFIKSRDMSEDLYYAMECRGFTGEYRASRVRLTWRDGIFWLLNAGIVLAYLYLS
jgi:cobalt/nickel transport system permease protein